MSRAECERPDGLSSWMDMKAGSRVLLMTLGFVLGASGLASAQEGRLIILGFDGLDHGITSRMMAEGQLPNLKALAEEGEFRALETTNPAISPVSWAALTTGRDPGRTGIDGFLRRDFADGSLRIKPSLVEKTIDRSGLKARANRRYVIIPLQLLAIACFFLSLGRGKRARRIAALLFLGLFSGALYVSENSFPDGMPRARNLRQGETFWEALDRAGVKTSTMLAPCSFPAPELKSGRILAGLGTPDAAGTFGTWTLFRDDVDSAYDSETGGSVKPLVYKDAELGDGRFEPIFIDGPPNVVKDDGSITRVPLAVTVSKDNGVAYITNGRNDAKIANRGWSEPFPLVFKQSEWVAVRGFTRIKLLEIDERVRLYVDPVSLDPTRLPPGAKLSHPDDFALDLMTAVGAFETVGWACATNALKDGALDEASFLEDAQRVWEEQENLALHELRRDDARVVTCVITVPDRIQHMFARYDDLRDEDITDRDPRFKRAVAEAYKRVDHFVGLVRKNQMKAEDRLLIVSDHGMAPFRKAVNLNAFLIEKGYLVLKQRIGARKLDKSIRGGVDMQHVDWERTRAYALGLGRIYLNRADRDPGGIVPAEEVDALTEEIRRHLLALEDDGKRVMKSVARGDRLYSGEAIPAGSADLYVGFERGYRVSWQTCLGGADEPVIFNNASAWSGDHCSVDPAEVPGVLFSTLPLKSGPSRVVDIAATVLDWAGVPFKAEDERDGRSLLARDEK